MGKIDFYFSANNEKNDDMKKKILLRSVGTSIFDILRDIIVSDTLKEVSYEDFLKKAKENVSPCPGGFVEQFKFKKHYENMEKV